MPTTTLSGGALLVSTRRRDVWTAQDKRLLDRLAKILNLHDVRLQLRCANPVCPAPAMVLWVDDTAPGGRILRCGCTDRQFSRTH